MTIHYQAPLSMWPYQPPTDKTDIRLLDQDATSVTGGRVTNLRSGTVLCVFDMGEFMQLAQKLQETLDEVRSLREELSQRPIASSINLYDLGTDEVKVERPISVVLHETDDEALARWPEVRAYGLGNTLAEAIFELKQNIVLLFQDLRARSDDTLGEIALDTLRTLNAHLRATR